MIAYRSGELPPEPTDRSGPNNRAEMQDFLGRLAAKHGSRKYTTNNRPSEWEVYSSDANDQVKLLKTRPGLLIVCQVDIVTLSTDCMSTKCYVSLFLPGHVYLRLISFEHETTTKIKCVQCPLSQTFMFSPLCSILCAPLLSLLFPSNVPC